MICTFTFVILTHLLHNCINTHFLINCIILIKIFTDFRIHFVYIKIFFLNYISNVHFCTLFIWQKETSSISEKSFAVGTLAETLLACGQVSVNFVDPLYPLFMKMIRDEDEEVRSNSIFALGVLLGNSGDKLFPYPFDISVIINYYANLRQML